MLNSILHYIHQKHFIAVCKKFTLKLVSFHSSCANPNIVQTAVTLIFKHYMLFSSCMWQISSCGSPSSDTRSMQCCTRWFRLLLVLEEQSVDLEQSLCCWRGMYGSIFSPFLQQSVSLHPSPPQQPGPACSTSRSSMLSETELTLGGGFSKARLMPSIIVSSCCETCCRRSVTEARMGLCGCWIWHQHNIALWRETQRGNSVGYNGTEKWLGQASTGQKRVFNNDQNKRGSWSFWAKKKKETERVF